VKINPAAASGLARAHQSPAKAAIEFRAGKDELSGTPFGQTVSQFARRELLPAQPSNEPAAATAPENETIASSGEINIIV
jgi:hypothetical protein